MSTWKIIKLELDRTGDFPKGSPGRCYLLRLPLLSDGRIDEAECAANPRQATVRRFWPQEADQSGYIVCKGGRCAITGMLGMDGDEEQSRFEDQPLVPGVQLVIAEPCGVKLPFRVTSVTAA